MEDEEIIQPKPIVFKEYLLEKYLLKGCVTSYTTDVLRTSQKLNEYDLEFNKSLTNEGKDVEKLKDIPSSMSLNKALDFFADICLSFIQALIDLNKFKWKI